jgi:hypothetical protein
MVRPIEQQNKDKYHKDHANDSGRAVAPGPRIAPGWQATDQSKNQQNDENIEKHISSLCFELHHQIKTLI